MTFPFNMAMQDQASPSTSSSSFSFSSSSPPSCLTCVFRPPSLLQRIQSLNNQLNRNDLQQFVSNELTEHRRKTEMKPTIKREMSMEMSMETSMDEKVLDSLCLPCIDEQLQRPCAAPFFKCYSCLHYI